MLLMLSTALWSSSRNEVYSKGEEINEINETDMANQPMVTVTYDEYHTMKAKVEAFEKMANKHSVCIRRPGQYDWTEYILVTPYKALKDFKEQYDEVFKETQFLKREVEVHEHYIEHLENRGLLARILNKK